MFSFENKKHEIHVNTPSRIELEIHHSIDSCKLNIVVFAFILGVLSLWCFEFAQKNYYPLKNFHDQEISRSRIFMTLNYVVYFIVILQIECREECQYFKQHNDTYGIRSIHTVFCNESQSCWSCGS